MVDVSGLLALPANRAGSTYRSGVRLSVPLQQSVAGLLLLDWWVGDSD